MTSIPSLHVVASYRSGHHYFDVVRRLITGQLVTVARDLPRHEAERIARKGASLTQRCQSPRLPASG